MRARLKAERELRGLTQKQMSDMLHVSERYYKAIEYGDRLGAIDLWDKMESIFDVHQMELRKIQLADSL